MVDDVVEPSSVEECFGGLPHGQQLGALVSVRTGAICNDHTRYRRPSSHPQLLLTKCEDVSPYHDRGRFIPLRTLYLPCVQARVVMSRLLEAAVHTYTLTKR